IQGILRAMVAIRAFAILISVKATAIIAGGGALLISRSGQLLGLLRGTGMSGVRALQTLFFRLQGVVTQAQAAASSPFSRGAMNRLLHGVRNNLPNIQWHHIVEQNAANTARFGSRAIQSVANVVPTPAHVHSVITSFYNSGPAWVRAQGFSRFRDWLAAQPWEQHYQIGLQIWRQAMRTGRITWP
ncbi:MAG: hypothetical protein KJO17_13955, partial [Acidimicrobiia bacterium]|nr:hypothetical protein [Acidimicrobiia bacterium]